MPTAEARAARNENLYREVNEAIESIQQQLGEGGPTSEAQFICECSRYRCADRVTLTLAEYAQVRSEDTHFLVLPGHIDPDIERVIRQTDEYAVVEKFGLAGTIAEADAN